MKASKLKISSVFSLLCLVLMSCTKEEQQLSINEQRLELAKSECNSQGWTNWGVIVERDTSISFGMSDSLYNQLSLTMRFQQVTLRNICTNNDTSVMAVFSWCNVCPEKDEYFESVTKGNVMNVYTSPFYLRYDMTGEIINYDSLVMPKGW